MMEIAEILLSEEEIARKVQDLAAAISRDYQDRELVLVCILKGAITFTADLMRRLSIPSRLDFVHASSYGLGTESSRSIRIKKDIETDITGRHVLLVDGIIDTGETLHCLFAHFSKRRPASLHAVVLLDKRSRRTVDVPLKYAGFEIPDKFVVGYGMDCSEQYRFLPHVAVVKTAGA